jgi:hypothetical protein
MQLKRQLTPPQSQSNKTPHIIVPKMYKGITLFKKKETKMPNKWQGFVLKFSVSMT